MSGFLLGATIAVALLIVLGLYRIAVGPSVFDRLVATALVTANGVVLLVLTGFLFDRVELFVDIAIAYALLAFLLPLALGRFFEPRSRGHRPAGGARARGRSASDDGREGRGAS
jgi:multicomponent Na+:H+ antiporter subunit F